MLPEVSRARVFSPVDLKSGCWHYVVAAELNILNTPKAARMVSFAHRCLSLIQDEEQTLK